MSDEERISLLDVYYNTEESVRHLFRLLAERDPIANISHKKMPCWEDHVRFVEGHPYMAWYLISVVNPPVDISVIAGAIYLTRMREVGIGIHRTWQRRGIGREAVIKLRELHPGHLLANIAPENARSMRFFESLGFRHKQNTYELD